MTTAAPAQVQPPTTSAPPPRAHSTAARRTAIALAACGLGAIPLQELFRDTSWLLVVWATMAVVIAPAMLLRLRRDAEPWHVWPGLVLLVPWLTLLFVRDHAWGHLIPTTGTWTDVRQMLTDLHHTTAHEVAPIHSTKPVRLVLCAMLGLLAALVDLIAVVGRRGALASVPLLVIFTAAGAIPKHGVGWVLFVFGALGFLLLLALDAEDDRREWGRRIPRPGRARAPRNLGISAQRVGIVAIIAALALPLVLPAHNGNLLVKLFRTGSSGPGGFGTGGGTIDPFVALKGQLVRSKPQPLFTVQLTRRPNKAVPYYSRVNVLSDYTGDGWRRGSGGVDEPLEQTTFQTTPPSSLIDPVPFEGYVQVSGLGGNPPVFDRPTHIDGVGAGTRWSETEQLLTGDSVSSGDHINESWLQPDPSLDVLRAASAAVTPQMQQYLGLPATMPTYVLSLVQSLTDTTDGAFDKARKIFDYFTKRGSGFSYSLRTKTGDSGSELVDFLKNKEGFCQQYAAAMGVMLRIAGVPSRIVLGYTHPLPDANNRFTVTTNDAHSWVEAYFEGVGWIPFDPTPVVGINGGSANDPAWAKHPTEAPAPTDSDPLKSTNTTGGASGGPAAPTGANPSGSAAEQTSGGTIDTGLLVVLGAIAVVALLAMTPGAIRSLRRRRRIATATRHHDPDPLWVELSDTAIDLGYVWSSARSPRQVAAWLRPDAAAAAPALDALAGAVETARYAPAGVATQHDVRDLAAELSVVTKALRMRRSGRTRFLSRFWPTSLGVMRRWRLSRWLPHRRH